MNNESDQTPLPAADAGTDDISPAGTARLKVLFIAAVISFFGPSLLDYALPLYFPAAGLPVEAWDRWYYGIILSWTVAPLPVGLLAGRIGERRAWTLGLLVYATLPFLLVAMAKSGQNWLLFMYFVALWYGTGASLIWIGGLSLAQVVLPRRRSLSNTVMMTALGVGATGGPLLGRAIVNAASGGEPTTHEAFFPAFILFGALAAVAAALIYIWGQRSGVPHESLGASGRSGVSPLQAFSLLRSRRFVITIIALGLLGGVVFQAGNVYRAYRAAEPFIGLIAGAEDNGWGAVQSFGYIVQLLAGLAIAIVAGKRTSRIVAAGILAGFSLSALGIGLSPNALWFVVSMLVFEAGRQFLRWAQTGFISEQVAPNQRSAAISMCVMLSGTGGFLYSTVMGWWQPPGSPQFSTFIPFAVAAIAGLVGGLILIVAHRIVTHRDHLHAMARLEATMVKEKNEANGEKV